MQDEAIWSTLAQPLPVTHQKNVWAFWQTGMETMAPWTKRNVISWVRRLPGWDIRILDRADTAHDIKHYLDPSYFPKCFNDGTMEGKYAPAHSADLVRLACLSKYGGVWLDVSILLFRSLDDICWDVLTDPANDYELCGFVIPEVHGEHQHEYGYMENWFIAANRDNPWIKRWHKIFLTFWQDKVESKDVAEHALFLKADLQGYRQDMIDYLAQHISFQRLRLIEDPTDGFSGSHYFSTHMYLLDARHEAYYLPEQTQWQGQVAFDIMSAPRRVNTSQDHDRARHAIARSAEHKKVSNTVGPFCNGELSREDNDSFANHIVDHMATSTCLTKAVHGFKGDTQLSDLWNAPENSDRDIEVGSCAEFLRWASVNIQQDRKLTPMKVVLGSERILVEPVV